MLARTDEDLAEAAGQDAMDTVQHGKAFRNASTLSEKNEHV